MKGFLQIFIIFMSFYVLTVNYYKFLNNSSINIYFNVSHNNLIHKQLNSFNIQYIYIQGC